MKRIIFILTFFLLSTTMLSAQKLIIGDRAPELKVKEWITPKPSYEGSARLVEFFFSTSKPSVDRIAALETIAQKYKGKLAVIVIAKESKEKVAGIIGNSKHYAAALDDASRTFDTYGVQFVPYCVLIDSKGHIVWFGNSSSLTEQLIEKYL